MSKFEDNLWGDLKHEHAAELLQSVATQRRLRTRRWVGIAAGVVVLGATAVVAPVYFGGTPPAYAVVDNPDGSVTLTIHELQRFEEATAKLREKGVPAIVVPLREGCPRPAPGPDEPLGLVKIESSEEGTKITVVPGEISADATVVLATAPAEGDRWIIAGGTYSREKPPSCLPMPSRR
ncbi:hypothetical protein UK23_06885 [Lentzea aerocolonigenes]|uniref:Uncharacterized protein n=1 Tax=Lentzea aerocolonigenes TaxID=68170 RepID=A0A0F0H987_LENAE|nr:hypothetical protein [Lentzea aerocolonigenes]KJK51406.1 hypothetical protein UK23_06885 [Lentzea aerocolonigenes]